MFEIIIATSSFAVAVATTFAVGVACGRRAAYRRIFSDRDHGQWMLEKLAQLHQAKVEMVKFPGGPS